VTCFGVGNTQAQAPFDNKFTASKAPVGAAFVGATSRPRDDRRRAQSSFFAMQRGRRIGQRTAPLGPLSRAPEAPEALGIGTDEAAIPSDDALAQTLDFGAIGGVHNDGGCASR